jgi:2-(1,2-epoxy-1,2-dihydrophenyl)acetyl-CoA isomerase
MNSVVTEKRNAVAWITLNRSDVLNALDPDMAAALHHAITNLVGDAKVRCVVVCGEGKGFMAGGDVGFFGRSLKNLSAGDPGVLEELFGHVHGAIRAIRQLSQPVIAAVHGPVAGFGISLMSACDLAIAADTTDFTLAYCHIGASPDGGSTFVLPRTIGLKRSMELALLGERFDAKRALSIGLVNWVVPEPELRQRAETLARRVASGPAYAYAQTKALINISLEHDLEQQLDLEQSSFIDCTKTKDFAEGVTAFLEKRKPRFAGK